jgi:formylglycine-generating enzyme required for sulfatase activity
VEYQPGNGLAYRRGGEREEKGRAVRGGSYLTRSFAGRSTHRVAQQPDREGDGIGLRPAREIEGR